MTKEILEKFMLEMKIENNLNELKEASNNAFDYLFNEYSKIEKREVQEQLGDVELLVESTKELISKLEEIFESELSEKK